MFYKKTKWPKWLLGINTQGHLGVGHLRPILKVVFEPGRHSGVLLRSCFCDYLEQNPGAPSRAPTRRRHVILEGNKMVPDPLVLVVMHGSWQPAVTFLSVPRRGVTVLQRTEQELPLVRRRKNRNGFLLNELGSRCVGEARMSCNRGFVHAGGIFLP